MASTSPAPSDTNDEPASLVLSLFDRSVRVLGRLAPAALIAAGLVYGLIEFTKAQSKNQEEVIKALDKVTSTLAANAKRLEENFSSIQTQQEKGQAIYQQLNRVMSEQMDNLQKVSATQKLFTEDSTAYFLNKLKNVTDEMSRKEAEVAAKTKELQNLESVLKTVRAQTNASFDIYKSAVQTLGDQLDSARKREALWEKLATAVQQKRFTEAEAIARELAPPGTGR